MNEDDHIREINALRREVSGAETPIHVYRKIEEALTAHPESPALWCIRGDAIQLGPEDSPSSLEDSLRSYETALRIDPDFAEAHESIGYYFDCIETDLLRSESAFLSAMRCGGGDSSVAGLARVLAELGRPIAVILSMLDQYDLEHSHTLQAIREEIEAGMWQPIAPNDCV